MKAFGSHFSFFGRGRRRLCRALRSFALRRINLNQRKSEVNKWIIIISHIYLSVEQIYAEEPFDFRSKVENISKNVFQRGTAIYEMSCICIESVDSYRVETSIVLFAINETDKI